MAKTKNVDREDIVFCYELPNSIPEVAERLGISRSTVRYHLAKAGVLRKRTEALHIAARKGRLSASQGRKRDFSAEWKRNIARAKRRHSQKYAKGTTLKAKGYIEITKGANKGRMQHRVVMESILGRKLLPYECVHHKDGRKANNHPDNLEIMTRSEHSRHHAHENSRTRKRDEKGRFA